ncbi:hypothetical protein GCM10023074_62510 [Microbispora amethystogenes]|uniref:Uncharacterized protein n=2 Tax=Microbispora amethystogenes TaxID=1427754 RepID=A0ABQ4FNY8_9ACTN|nr:hypothetical protein Mam01_66950 [Microbispora amethystogenes]
MVTVPARADLHVMRRRDFPVPVGADDARRAAWVAAGSYPAAVAALAMAYGGHVFAAHRPMLAELLGSGLPEVTR